MCGIQCFHKRKGKRNYLGKNKGAVVKADTKWSKYYYTAVFNWKAESHIFESSHSDPATVLQLRVKKLLWQKQCELFNYQCTCIYGIKAGARFSWNFQICNLVTDYTHINVPQTATILSLPYHVLSASLREMAMTLLQNSNFG